MTKTPAPCAPPAGTPDGSWHWLEHNDVDGVDVVRNVNEWSGTRWRFGTIWHGPSVVATLGYRYHSPVPAPEEVEALRRVIAHMRSPDGVHISQALVATGLAEWLPINGTPPVLTPLGRRALGFAEGEEG